MVHTKSANGPSTSKTVYSVAIEGERTIGVLSCSTAGPARAEALAKLMELPLEDSTSGTVDTRDYDKLDETLGQKLKREGSTLELPRPPENCTINFESRSDKGVFAIPASGFGGMFPALVMIAVVIPFVVPLASSSFSSKDPIGLVLTALFLVPVSLTSLKIVWDAINPQVLEVSRDALTLRRCGVSKGTIGHIFIKELEELNLVGSRLAARSDKGNLSITLPSDEEAKWVKQVIEYILLQMEK